MGLLNFKIMNQYPPGVSNGAPPRAGNSWSNFTSSSFSLQPKRRSLRLKDVSIEEPQKNLKMKQKKSACCVPSTDCCALCPIETRTCKARGQTQAKGGVLFWLLLIRVIIHYLSRVRLFSCWTSDWSGNYCCLQKAPAKPKKAKEVEKAKPEEKAPEAPAENGEAKAEDEVTVRT